MAPKTYGNSFNGYANLGGFYGLSFLFICTKMQELPDDMLLEILLWIDTDSEFARLCLVCKHWFFTISYKDSILWKTRTQRLFKGKHLSRELKSLPMTKSTYLFALEDAKRTVLTREELCNELWGMRLHDNATTWAAVNPTNPNEYMYRRFLPNGAYWYPRDNTDPLYSHPVLGQFLDRNMRWGYRAGRNSAHIQLLHENLEGAFPPMEAIRIPATWSWEVIGTYAKYVILKQ